jgi:hypothetical protein
MNGTGHRDRLSVANIFFYARLYRTSTNMSLDKGIEHGKERRKEYRGNRKFDRSCRHGGSCDRCRSGREHNGKRRGLSAQEILTDYLRGVDKD